MMRKWLENTASETDTLDIMDGMILYAVLSENESSQYDLIMQLYHSSSAEALLQEFNISCCIIAYRLYILTRRQEKNHHRQTQMQVISVYSNYKNTNFTNECQILFYIYM